MKKIAVLISNKGIGTNLQAIIDGITQKKINGKIVIVISDTQEAVGLERARKYNLNIEICPRKELLFKTLKKYNPDFLCLAGWKQIVTDDIIDAFSNKIVNLHPGLIPNGINRTVNNPDRTKALWNRGKLTDKAIQNFLDNKSTYAGSSLFLLSKDFDFGKVLDRCFEKVQMNDTVETLYSRLKQKENQMYIDVLRKLCK